MDAPFAGAAIPRRNGTGDWNQDICREDTFGTSAISVMAGPGLLVTDGAGPGVTGMVM